MMTKTVFQLFLKSTTPFTITLNGMYRKKGGKRCYFRLASTIYNYESIDKTGPVPVSMSTHIKNSES